jgi:flagellar hook protein FlgE
MKNNQIRMDVIGNNISNVNTTAYKTSRVRFQDILSQTIKNASAPMLDGRGGINPRQVGLGMQVAGIDTIVNNGSLQPTGRPLDCAVDGEGYFVLSDGNKVVYSRDGAFNFDTEFNVVNSDGYKLMGYRPTTATMKVLYKDNLSDGGGVNWGNATLDTQLKQNSSITLRGPLGSHTFSFTMPADPTDPATPVPTVGDVIHAINSFSDTTGIRASYKDGLMLEASFNIDDKASANNVLELSAGSGDFAGLDAADNVYADDAQIDETSFTDLNNLWGLDIPEKHPLKSDIKINNFSIESNGTIKGVYEDGSVVALGKVALARFANPAGLMKLGANNYSPSANSGDARIGEAGIDGAGDIAQSSLEMSNVDLASEFTDMIITSRAFQANSRTITTSDEMLQELLNLKR